MTVLPSDPRRGASAAPDAAAAEAVDRAMAGLDGLADRPLVDHVAVFEQIHAALGDALSAAPAAGEVAGRA